MVDPHLGPPKSPTGAISRPKWSPGNRGLITVPSATREGREKHLSAWAV